MGRITVNPYGQLMTLQKQHCWVCSISMTCLFMVCVFRSSHRYNMMIPLVHGICMWHPPGKQPFAVDN